MENGIKKTFYRNPEGVNDDDSDGNSDGDGDNDNDDDDDDDDDFYGTTDKEERMTIKQMKKAALKYNWRQGAHDDSSGDENSSQQRKSNYYYDVPENNKDDDVEITPNSSIPFNSVNLVDTYISEKTKTSKQIIKKSKPKKQARKKGL